MAITLNVIGAGRAGRTLARVLAAGGAVVIGDVFDEQRSVAAAAVEFIGGGRAAPALPAMQAAGAWMLTTTDANIVPAGKALAASGLLAAGDVVFHCSGATPSQALKDVMPATVAVASVHPLRSFADPATAAATFAGAYCAAEGDEAALARLTAAFESAGARVARIDARFKTVYHAASVIVCNYLAALMEAGLQSYIKAGLDRAAATRMMEPLVRETLDNIFKLGTADALTGPIARGDSAIVKRQIEALEQWNPAIAGVYRTLGSIAVELARGKTDSAALDDIARSLREPQR